jgi:hypothetical protein
MSEEQLTIHKHIQAQKKYSSIFQILRENNF